MVNPFREVNWQPGLAERRRFAASWIVGFPGVALGLLLVGRWSSGAWSIGSAVTLGGAGLVLGMLLWVAPQMARPFYVGWYAVACCLGFVVGNVALVAIYFFLLTPVALARRALGRSALRQGFDRTAASYWHEAPAAPEPARYFRQY